MPLLLYLLWLRKPRKQQDQNDLSELFTRNDNKNMNIVAITLAKYLLRDLLGCMLRWLRFAAHHKKLTYN
jgi:hypothetical protein